MKELPEELTSELLSLVLDKEVIRLGSFNFPNLEILVKGYSYSEWEIINIDSLTRLMIEFCLKQGHQMQVFYQCDGSIHIKSGLCGYGWDDYNRACNNYLNAWTGIANYVAKEKGLI